MFGFRRKITVDPELVAELSRLLEENKLTEIEVQRGDQRVRVSRASGVAPMAALPAAAVAGGRPGPSAGEDHAAHPGVVKSPMVGTVYVAPEPGAKPFVEDGQEVREGQTLLVIEAMKTMNAIPAPRAGRVKRILIEDAQPVEYGEPLMIIE
jgi:acetyl-CoA carboxylase biotin carboxyl carrier protein